MKKGSILKSVTVTDAGSKGKNIARAGNFVVLVDNAVPGDVIDVQIFRKKKGFAEGTAVHFHEYSTLRQQAKCIHFDYCGGCSWQNINYDAQLQFKQKMVQDAFERIGKLEFAAIDPILPSATTEFYRNRLDFAFSDRRWLNSAEMEQKLPFSPGLGFHISGRFDKVLNIEECLLQPEPSNELRNKIREKAIAEDYPFFNPRTQEGSLRSLIIRTTTTGELMVILIFYKETKERIAQMMDFIKNEFPSITSLFYVENPKANDTVYDLPHQLYSGRSYIIEEINGITYRIGAKSFFQTNPEQAKTLITKAIEFADIQAHELVYDLYTGVGSIALQAAKKARKVIGIETVAEAIDYAKNNAADNAVENADFFAGDVKDILNDDFIAKHGKPDVIFSDPPRVGMDQSVIDKILEMNPERIVYVSCNPATQARDLALLQARYSIVTVLPVDMFPHTYHVENICLLKKIE